jgi:hypothetical protein
MKPKSTSGLGAMASLDSLMIGALIALALPHADLAEAANADARIVLHAQPYSAGNTCSTPQQSLGLNCDSVRPAVTVTPGQAVEVYVYFHSYDSIAAAQMAFTWHSSWTFVYWIGACQAHELLAVPTPQASGDSYIGAFDPITGGLLQPLGRMRFVVGNAGTQFTITETWAPGGTGVIDYQLAFSPIPVINRGVIAVSSPGVDACGGKSESSALFEE